MLCKFKAPWITKFICLTKTRYLIYLQLLIFLLTNKTWRILGGSSISRRAQQNARTELAGLGEPRPHCSSPWSSHQLLPAFQHFPLGFSWTKQYELLGSSFLDPT